jgi:squalene-hopene/tetraprenyl-beta-curcumene cyclase
MTNLDLNSQTSTSESIGSQLNPQTVPQTDLGIEVPARAPKATDLHQDVSQAVMAAREFMFSIQREQGHWCAELESNSTITSEYILMCQMLGLKEPLKTRGPKLAQYLLSEQKPDGSWSIAHGCDGDISSTAEAYLALRILGLEQEHPALMRAQSYILRNGGLEKLRIFTRIFFAMFGLLPWNAVPAIPPEAILLPPQAPVNVFALSSWARGTMIPLFIIAHHRPVYALPNGKSDKNTYLDHLWLNPADKNVPYAAPWTQMILRHGPGFKSFFGIADLFLKMYERTPINALRRKALDECTRYILTRQEESGDWAGIFPPMMNGVIALTLQGYGLDSDPVRKGIEAIHRFSWEDESGYRIQACNSPIWDTVLGTIGMIDSKADADDPRFEKAMNWVLKHQILVEHGDWKVYRPKLPAGGWAFEYENSWYPDIDDTAAVILALLKQDPKRAESEAVQRAVRWVIGMQNRDGGWAAFDVDNDKLFLNEIPFSDMDSLCDPSTPDVTGRVIEALGFVLSHSKLMEKEIVPACEKALNYIRKTQELPGSWYGRWGVNYVYGTSNVLCGLARLTSLTSTNVSSHDPMVVRATEWLKQVQNADGGWGESLASYADKRWMGRGESTASQTAWALMGLLAYLPAHDEAITRGVQWLLKTQVPAQASDAFEGDLPVPSPKGKTWDEKQFTGTGFPNYFYLRYHLYRHYFPMMALGRYLRALEN